MSKFFGRFKGGKRTKEHTDSLVMILHPFLKKEGSKRRCSFPGLALLITYYSDKGKGWRRAAGPQQDTESCTFREKRCSEFRSSQHALRFTSL
jgi:hypothetical protein